MRRGRCGIVEDCSTSLTMEMSDRHISLAPGAELLKLYSNTVTSQYGSLLNQAQDKMAQATLKSFKTAPSLFTTDTSFFSNSIYHIGQITMVIMQYACI